MVDAACAEIVAGWLKKNGVALRTGRHADGDRGVAGQAQALLRSGRRRSPRTWSSWPRASAPISSGSTARTSRGAPSRAAASSWTTTCARASRNVYAGGDVARGRESPDRDARGARHRADGAGARARGRRQHGGPRRAPIAAASLMNIVEVCHLDVASFGAWEDPRAEVYTGVRPERSLYRKLLFHGGRLAGAVICGPASDIWTTNDVGMLKGLVLDAASTSRPGRRTSQRNPVRRQAGVHRHAHDGALLPANHPRAAQSNRPVPPGGRMSPSDRNAVTEGEAHAKPSAEPRRDARRLRRPAPARDLTTGKCWTEPWGARRHARVARRHRPRAPRSSTRKSAPARCSWDHPDNRLILATGPLAGLPVWGTGGLTVITLGAMTGGADVHAGQRLLRHQPQVLRLRRHRHPGPGRRSWVYLYINDDVVELRDAAHCGQGHVGDAGRARRGARAPRSPAVGLLASVPPGRTSCASRPSRATTATSRPRTAAAP